MSEKYEILAFVMLFNIVSQIEKEIEAGTPNIPPILYRYYGQGKLWLKNRKPNEKVLEIINKMKTDESFEDITMKEISYILFSLDSIRLYTERIPREKRPMLNISDKKLLIGSRRYVIDMLRLKKRDSETYRKTKKLFEDTEQTATDVFDWIYTEVQKYFYGKNKERK